MRAPIYRPSRTGMQSGKARTKLWLLEYEPERPRPIDPLMGWPSSADTRHQTHPDVDTAPARSAQAPPGTLRPFSRPARPQRAPP